MAAQRATGVTKAPTVAPDAFWGALTDRGFNLFSGVADSTLAPLYGAAMEQAGVRYVPAPREDAALGVASAAYFGGGRGGVLLQNSGLGNLVNPLTSFSLMYRIPVLLIIGWRGYEGRDAPEHRIMGARTVELLDLLAVPHATLESEGGWGGLDRLVRIMDRELAPTALLVRPGVLGR